MNGNSGTTIKGILLAMAAAVTLGLLGVYFLMVRPPSGEFSAEVLESLSPDAVLVLQDGNAAIKGPNGLVPYGRYSKSADGWILRESGEVAPWLIERNLGGFYLVHGTNKTIRYKFVRTWFPK